MKQALTLTVAEQRKHWRDNWRELRAYAGQVATTYCLRRLRQLGPDGWREIRDEALSEAWRYCVNGETPEKAIVKAVDVITQTRQRHAARQRPLPDLPEHRPEWHAGEERVSAIVLELPRRLRPLAVILSAEPDMPNTELAGMLDCSEKTVRNYKAELREQLQPSESTGPRRGDWLGWLANAFVN